ncbi:MAG: T9SS type A sorting domain-containing protein, partial [Hymenobacter sp.]
AKWNGTRWSALSVTDQYGYVSNGVDRDGTVYALAVSGSNLYVGGIFTGAGIVAANNVAKWDGTRWSSLGTGTANGVSAVVNSTAASYVYALAVSGTNVYVGGIFGRAGAAAAANVARWNGTAWSSLGTGAANGVNSTVYALGVVGPTLYVGGDFKQAGGASANYLARWDGTSWSTLGTGTTNGVSAGVRAMAVAGNNLYVGGNFATAGTTPVNYVAKWDGTTWSPLGTGTATGTNGTVAALAVAGSTVYAGGYFSKAGGATVGCVAKWDGTSWSSLGTGLNGAVRALGTGTDTKVNVGGQFIALGDGSKAAFYFSVYNDGPTVLSSPTPTVAAQVSVYPNPSQGSFSVTMPGLVGAATVRAELLTGLGQVVRRQVELLPASGTTFTLSTNGLAPGSYILRLSAGATILTKQVAIQ